MIWLAGPGLTILCTDTRIGCQSENQKKLHLPESVNTFFDILEEEYFKHNYTPNRIYNVDETYGEATSQS